MSFLPDLIDLQSGLPSRPHPDLETDEEYRQRVSLQLQAANIVSVVIARAVEFVRNNPVDTTLSTESADHSTSTEDTADGVNEVNDSQRRKVDMEMSEAVTDTACRVDISYDVSREKVSTKSDCNALCTDSASRVCSEQASSRPEVSPMASDGPPNNTSSTSQCGVPIVNPLSASHSADTDLKLGSIPTFTQPPDFTTMDTVKYLSSITNAPARSKADPTMESVEHPSSFGNALSTDLDRPFNKEEKFQSVPSVSAVTGSSVTSKGYVVHGTPIIISQADYLDKDIEKEQPFGEMVRITDDDEDMETKSASVYPGSWTHDSGENDPSDASKMVHGGGREQGDNSVTDYTTCSFTHWRGRRCTEDEPIEACFDSEDNDPEGFSQKMLRNRQMFHQILKSDLCGMGPKPSYNRSVEEPAVVKKKEFSSAVRSKSMSSSNVFSRLTGRRSNSLCVPETSIQLKARFCSVPPNSPVLSHIRHQQATRQTEIVQESRPPVSGLTSSATVTTERGTCPRERNETSASSTERRKQWKSARGMSCPGTVHDLNEMGLASYAAMTVMPFVISEKEDRNEADMDCSTNEAVCRRDPSAPPSSEGGAEGSDLNIVSEGSTEESGLNTISESTSKPDGSDNEFRLRTATISEPSSKRQSRRSRPQPPFSRQGSRARLGEKQAALSKAFSVPGSLDDSSQNFGFLIAGDISRRRSSFGAVVVKRLSHNSEMARLYSHTHREAGASTTMSMNPRTTRHSHQHSVTSMDQAPVTQHDSIDSIPCQASGSPEDEHPAQDPDTCSDLASNTVDDTGDMDTAQSQHSIASSDIWVDDVQSADAEDGNGENKSERNPLLGASVEDRHWSKPWLAMRQSGGRTRIFSEGGTASSRSAPIGKGKDTHRTKKLLSMDSFPTFWARDRPLVNTDSLTSPGEKLPVLRSDSVESSSCKQPQPAREEDISHAQSLASRCPPELHTPQDDTSLEVSPGKTVTPGTGVIVSPGEISGEDASALDAAGQDISDNPESPLISRPFFNPDCQKLREQTLTPSFKRKHGNNDNSAGNGRTTGSFKSKRLHKQTSRDRLTRTEIPKEKDKKPTLGVTKSNSLDPTHKGTQMLSLLCPDRRPLHVSEVSEGSDSVFLSDQSPRLGAHVREKTDVLVDRGLNPPASPPSSLTDDDIPDQARASRCQRLFDFFRSCCGCHT